MANVVLIIITVLIIYLSVKMIIKNFNEAKDPFEKVMYTVMSMAILIPLILYYLDRFNIPTMLRYTKNVDSKQWLDIISSYFSSIISTIISVVFLVYVTIKQIERTYQDNERLNKENQRLQNLPLLNYTINHGIFNTNIFDDTVTILSNQTDYNDKSINLLIEVKNIGVNSIRRLFFTIESDFFETEIFAVRNQGGIEKDGSTQKEIIIIGARDKDYNICFTSYYQDLLTNWYEQKINVEISVTNKYKIETKDYVSINTITVNDEKCLKEIPPKIREKYKIK